MTMQMPGYEDPQERIRRMLEITPPPPLDPDVTAATSSDMSQPGQYGAQGGGAPAVLDFVKQLEQQGAFKTQEQTKPKGMVTAQQTVKSEQGGVPADVRARGVAVRGQAEMDDAAVERDRRIAQAEELEKRAAYLRQDAQVEQETREREESENAARQKRLREQQQELAEQKEEPVNPRRYFENMSLAAKGASLLSAAIYGYLGGRGQPPVVESLMRLAQEDTQAQITNNAASRDRRNSLIDQYERQYGDTTLVAKRLEADKLHTLAKVADSEALNAKSVELRDQAEDIGKKLRNRVGVLHQEIQEATYGKPVEVTTTYQPPKPAGGGDPGAAIKKALELDKLLEERGYTPEQRAAAIKAGGLPVAGGESAPTRTNREQAEAVERDRLKLTEKEGLAEGATQGIEQLGKAAGLVRNPQTHQWEPGPGAFPPALGEGVKGFFGGSTPVNDAMDAAVEGYGRFRSGGAIQDVERKAFRDQLGAGTTTRAQLASKLNAAETLIETSRSTKNRLDDEEERKRREKRKVVTGRIE